MRLLRPTGRPAADTPRRPPSLGIRAVSDGTPTSRAVKAHASPRIPARACLRRWRTPTTRQVGLERQGWAGPGRGRGQGRGRVSRAPRRPGTRGVRPPGTRSGGTGPGCRRTCSKRWRGRSSRRPRRGGRRGSRSSRCPSLRCSPRRTSATRRSASRSRWPCGSATGTACTCSRWCARGGGRPSSRSGARCAAGCLRT